MAPESAASLGLKQLEASMIANRSADLAQPTTLATP
jgi:hypothetical protein